MADVKWIKIVTDIFDDEKILLIEAMPEADSIITIWFKLLCLAGKQNNSGVFMLNNRIAYTDEMFATIFRRKLNTVRMALNTFENLGMIEIINGAVTIPNWGKHQNLERIAAEKEYQRDYQREYRARQKQLAEGNEEARKGLREGLREGLDKPNVKATDKERDKDKDREKNTDTSYPYDDEEDDYIITSRKAAIENAWKDEFGRKATPAIVRRLLKVLERNAIDDATLKDCITRTARREANDPANYLETLIMEEAERDRKRAAATP